MKRTSIIVWWMAVCSVVVLTAQESDINQTLDLYHYSTEDNTLILYASNRSAVEAFFSISAPIMVNMAASQPLPHIAVLEAGEQDVEVLTFSPVDANASTNLRYSYTSNFGNPLTAQHDPDIVYWFPYEHGTKYAVGQSHFGAYSHSDVQNRYAVDFNMEQGTPVHAARAGVVVDIKEDSTIGGGSSRYSSHANYITILHEDGTLGSYVHLQNNGALVEVGQQVKIGQLVGLSGNTGHSTGPHLHFGVGIPDVSGVIRSIPVSFITINDEIIEQPLVNSYYYSVHTDKQEFEIVLGKEIVADDYTGYIATIEQTNNIGVRNDRVDNTFIYFVENGLPMDVELEIQMVYSGVTSDVEYPVVLTVPALSEVFLGIFRTIEGARSVRIAPTITLAQER